MKKKSVYQEFCTGCGLCSTNGKVTFEEDANGFEYPLLSESDISLCERICPASGNALNNYATGSIWGNVKSSYLGWSKNATIRKSASSGGVLSTLCIYLLENNIVDGIIQVKKDPTNPTRTINVISRTREDVLQCVGSRYTVSSPLRDISKLIVEGEKYAFVGKPCDASALRMYMEEIRSDWKDQILYIFSFFCAGQPGRDANLKLIKTLGCEDEKDCSDLQYRGNGWPGKTIAWNSKGASNQMDYETSWMKILGRGTRYCCRFCADGTGEMADISCGDAWYLKEDGKPDIFTERDGRNVIFSRTAKGDELLNSLISMGLLYIEKFDPDKDGLRKMQPYHYTRKASLSSLKLALKVCRRNFPYYCDKKLNMFASDFPFKEKVLRCVGTIQRIINNKM